MLNKITAQIKSKMRFYKNAKQIMLTICHQRHVQISIILRFIGLPPVTFNQMIVAPLKGHGLDSSQPRFESSLYHLLVVLTVGTFLRIFL